MKQRENRIILKNYKLVMVFILGLIVASGGVYAATTIAGENITYSNTKSGLSSTDVQGAIDELYEKSDIRKSGKFVAAYTYSESGANKCITGEESTCKKITCYKTKVANSCPSGTIILYKVNDLTIVPFHVMFDNGSTMTMQSQKNIIYNIPWYADVNDNTKGPITILAALEAATAGWTNVNNQTYTMGTTVFKTNAYTGCSSYNSCTTNTYTLASRTARARLITVQEAVVLGCTEENRSCPIWMYNYLSQSTNYGGTVNDTNKALDVSDNYGYWVMSAYSSDPRIGWIVNYFGQVNFYHAAGTSQIINVTRPVVEVSK